MATGAAHRFGGKGGNQTVAAARCGGRVTFSGVAGTDEAAPRLAAGLDYAGVERGGVAVVPGPSDMSVAQIQNEVPKAANLTLVRALPADAMLILNAAPAREVTAELLARVDVLAVNRVETAQMGGLDCLRAEGAVIETLDAERCLLGSP